MLLNCGLSRSKEDFVEEDVVELEWHTRGGFLTGVGWCEAYFCSHSTAQKAARDAQERRAYFFDHRHQRDPNTREKLFVTACSFYALYFMYNVDLYVFIAIAIWLCEQ